jgi:hypothetical protein
MNYPYTTIRRTGMYECTQDVETISHFLRCNSCLSELFRYREATDQLRTDNLPVPLTSREDATCDGRNMYIGSKKQEMCIEYLCEGISRKAATWKTEMRRDGNIKMSRRKWFRECEQD